MIELEPTFRSIESDTYCLIYAYYDVCAELGRKRDEDALGRVFRELLSFSPDFGQKIKHKLATVPCEPEISVDVVPIDDYLREPEVCIHRAQVEELTYREYYEMFKDFYKDRIRKLMGVEE